AAGAGGGVAGGPVGVGRDKAPLPAPPPALLPDPPAGHRLAVAGRAHQQDAPFGPAAVLLDAAQVGRLQIADGVLPQRLHLARHQPRRLAWRRGIPPAADGDSVQPRVIPAVDRNEPEPGTVALVVINKADVDKADALDLVAAHAQADARVGA